MLGIRPLPEVDVNEHRNLGHPLLAFGIPAPRTEY
jgi:hypothetical protein